MVRPNINSHRRALRTDPADPLLEELLFFVDVVLHSSHMAINKASTQPYNAPLLCYSSGISPSYSSSVPGGPQPESHGKWHPPFD